jgi:hypothetical protein
LVQILPTWVAVAVGEVVVAPIPRMPEHGLSVCCWRLPPELVLSDPQVEAWHQTPEDCASSARISGRLLKIYYTDNNHHHHHLNIFVK